MSPGTWALSFERNVRDLLHGPVFEPLRTDYRAFRRARVRWGTVVWPGRLDLDPDVLIWNGPAPADPAQPEPRLALHLPLVVAEVE
jgi:hypothetical protein